MFRRLDGLTAQGSAADGRHVSEGVAKRQQKSSSKPSAGPAGDNGTPAKTKTTAAGAVARAPSAHSLPVSNLQPDQSRNIFFLSMIEERCRKEAASAINRRRSPGAMLSEDLEDVKAPTAYLYERVSREVIQLPGEMAAEQGSLSRRVLLSSFDTALTNAARHMSNNYLESTAACGDQKKIPSSLTLPPLPPSSSAVSRVGGNATGASIFLNGNSTLFGGAESVYLSEYQELSMLGKGGYGVVYRVRNRLDNQEYAVKKIFLSSERLQASRENDQIDAVLAELRTLAQLNHPNIVRYYHGWVEMYTSQEPAKKRKERKLLTPTRTSTYGCESPERAYDMTMQESSSAMAFSADHGTCQLYEEALDRDEREYKDMVTFGYSNRSRRRGTSYERDRERSSYYAREESRTTFNPNSLSTGNDSNDLETEDIPRNSRTPLSDVGSVATGSAQAQYAIKDHLLYIKMSLHPLTLLTYLSTDEPDPGDDIKLRHCFHLGPSVEILSAIIDGVEYLHSQKFIHRDLKPANIFLSIHENQHYFKGSANATACSQCSHLKTSKPIYVTPCIGDFGLIAQIKEPSSTEGRSSAQSLFQPSPLAELYLKPIGTYFYHPPKMPTKEPKICPKLDVYSLGIIAMELVYKFTTRAERIVVLTELGKGTLPANFDKHPMAAGIKAMVCRNRDKRWDLTTVRQWLNKLREAIRSYKGKGKA
jgi:eukaryotic translation initiation factor 2-alpha kinase 3